MRIKVSVLAAVMGLGFTALSTPALAGGCGIGSSANCGVGVSVIPSEAPKFGPITIENSHPMGHLRTIDFQRAPNVSITRVHGMAPTAALADAPSGFTGGCHPSSTQYCRASAGSASPIIASAAPVHSAPIVSAPVYSAPLRSWTGQGYNPSNFQSRQYGDNSFTPGIAHIPTSIVDRSPVNAQSFLNSGLTVTQPVVSPSSYASAPVAAGNGLYASNVDAGGTYWEKTAGVTRFGNTVATQVICKRQLPRQTVNPVVNVPVPVPTRVVNPIVRVPVGVPTPVPVSVPNCAPGANFGAIQNQRAGFAGGRYGNSQGSRWTF